MNRIDLKPGTLLAPLPAVMVSVGDMEDANVLTVAWTGILSSDPARAYISVRPGRYSHKYLLEKGEFVINLTTEALARATDYVGVFTGKKVDKFEKCGFTALPGSKVSAPVIAECPISLECQVKHSLSLGSHILYVGEILAVQVSSEFIDDKKHFDVTKADLLAYAHGNYMSLGETVGTFGYSVKKK